MTKPVVIDLDDETKPFSVFDTVTEIIKQFKERDHAEPIEQVVLQSASMPKRAAVMKVLNYAYFLSTSPEKLMENAEHGIAIIKKEDIIKCNLSGLAQIQSDETMGTTSIQLAKQSGKLPTHLMEQKLNVIRAQSFRPLDSFPSTQYRDEETGKVSEIPSVIHFYPHSAIAQMGLDIFSFIAQAHGMDLDHITTCFEGLKTKQGKLPAVLIREDTFKAMHALESAKARGRNPGE